MKVLFIYPNIIYKRRPLGLSHMGIGSLSAVLKKDGHSVSILNIYKKINRKTFIERVTEEKPDLLAFSATANMFFYVEQFCKWLLQENLRFKTICGGVHATLAPQEVIKTDGIDIVCIGEGESVLAELCRKLAKGEDITGVNNLWIKTKDGIKKNPVGPLLENLDELPFTDRDIFNKSETTIKNVGILPITASRGCFYNCVYCCNHALRSIYPNKDKYLRFRSPGNVVSEIKQILSQDPSFTSIIFYDDVFFLNKIWAKEFTALYKKEVSLPFRCNIRPELVDEEIAYLLKEAGCYMVSMGIESGNDYIRNQILKRKITRKQIQRGFNLFKSMEIKVYAFNMVGAPFEKPSDILETIKLNSELAPDEFQVSIFYPFIGTELYDMSMDKGFITNRKVGSFFNDSSLNLPTIHRLHILMFQRHFVRFVRCYSKLSKLPQPFSRVSINILDYLLKRFFIAMLLNILRVCFHFFAFIAFRVPFILFAKFRTLQSILKSRIVKDKFCNRLINKATAVKSMIHNNKNECPYSLAKRLLLPFKLKHGHRIDYPQYVWIDITNECNLRCIMCPQSKGLKRKKMTMEMDTFTKIIDQICIAKPRIVLHVSGEPLLNKNVFEMIKYVKDKGCKVTMFTNATLLTREVSIRILKTPLDNIFFSFDGCTQEIYEKIRVGANFDCVKSQIETFLKLRSEMDTKGPIVVIEIILMKETENHVSDFIKYWEGKSVDRIGIRLAGTWLGLADDHRSRTNIKDFGFKPCDSLFFGCAILAEGTVVPCCKDIEGRLPLGNILEQSFDEIWNGEAYNNLRRQHFENTIPENIICHSCAHVRCWDRKEQIRQWLFNKRFSLRGKE